MDRRTFLKLSALIGLSSSTPFFTASGRAQIGRYDGPYWALVNASGGWDPRFMFDPIQAGDQNRRYDAIASVGNVRFADYPVDLERMGLDTTLGYEQILLSNRQFVEKHGGRLTVLNGIDTSTNNHEAGSRTMWCGTIPGQYPAFGALVAAAFAPEQPMAFISAGGYDVTDHLVALARIENPGVLQRIKSPNVIDPNNAESDTYHSADTMNRILAAQADRLSALQQRHDLPVIRRSIDEMLTARIGVADLDRLELPPQLVDLPGGQLGDLERLEQQAQLAVAGFRSGVAVTATLNIGGFDTHADHDRNQSRQVTKLLTGIDFLLEEAAAAQIADRLYVVVASDFGRGPLYNSERDNAGKDHWPITSMLVMGPNVPGNRVIGGTDAGQRALNVDPASLQTTTDGGIRLRPELVHRALRKLAGVEEVASSYPLVGDDIALFG